MKQWRSQFPYEWCVSVSGAVMLAISPWVPSIPFSRLLAAWANWIGEPLLGRSLVVPYEGFLAAFLPIISAATLGLPLLAFCSLILDGSRPHVWVVRTAVVLMFLLSGMTAVGAVIDLGTWYVFSQIAVGCAIGALLAIFGGALYVKRALPTCIRLLGALLFASGACVATFGLLPVGLLLLGAAYIVLATVLARRRGRADNPRPSNCLES